MNRRAAVFGAAGQLGIELVRELKERRYSVQGWDRNQVDITDRGAVENALASYEAEVVFNCAAYNQVDVAEKEPQAAFLVNALAVRNLALASRQMDALLVHYSTDYVFDGFARVPYAEDDTTHPLGAYAVSKLAGELYAQAYLDKVLVVRTSGVFGPGGLSTARGNFVELMLRLANANNPIRVVADHVASPTYAPAIASRTADLVERNIRGLFHMGGGQAISWYEYAKMIFELAGLSPALQPTDEREYRTPARRPKFSALSNSKVEAAGIAPMPPLRDAVQEYLEARKHVTAHRSA
jgi:dTDP-4-dehydrorhamnose reductase